MNCVASPPAQLCAHLAALQPEPREALLLHPPQGHNFSQPLSSPAAAAAHLEKESVTFTLDFMGIL